SKKLHERYFCSDKVIFSCDKGIDIINEAGELVNNLHLSVLENSEAKKISGERVVPSPLIFILYRAKSRYSTPRQRRCIL
ncbi:MAG: hypothetical protein II262_03900, partial [Alistipes sp.]|nr:hypothetical protein [Alistipes sp.]